MAEDRMSTERVLHGIAVDVVNSNHGDFLKTFADAYLRADLENERILRPAWLVLVDKYQLDKEYKPTPAAEAEPHG